MIIQLRVFLDRWSPQILSMMRIVVAFLFMAHGTQALFGYPPSRDAFAGVDLFSWTGVTGVLETFGGLAILLGIFTRPVAMILVAETAVVYVTTFAPNGIWPRLNGGDLTLFYCFCFLYLASTGGGPWSLDAEWRGMKQAPTNGFATFEPQLRSILRIVVTFLFFTHGTEDILGWPWPDDEPFPGADLSGLSGTGHLMEVIGGPILLVGLFSRPLAFIFSGEMAVAYFLSHQPRAFWPIVNAGEDCIFFSFTFLYLAAVGGGPWALDRLFGWDEKSRSAVDSDKSEKTLASVP
jgi:putative oxidoreductase